MLLVPGLPKRPWKCWDSNVAVLEAVVALSLQRQSVELQCTVPEPAACTLKPVCDSSCSWCQPRHSSRPHRQLVGRWLPNVPLSPSSVRMLASSWLQTRSRRLLPEHSIGGSGSSAVDIRAVPGQVGNTWLCLISSSTLPALDYVCASASADDMQAGLPVTPRLWVFIPCFTRATPGVMELLYTLEPCIEYIGIAGGVVPRTLHEGAVIACALKALSP